MMSGGMGFMIVIGVNPKSDMATWLFFNNSTWQHGS